MPLNLTDENFVAVLEHLVEKLVVVEDQLFAKCQASRDIRDYEAWLTSQTQLRVAANEINKRTNEEQLTGTKRVKPVR